MERLDTWPPTSGTQTQVTGRSPTWVLSRPAWVSWPWPRPRARPSTVTATEKSTSCATVVWVVQTASLEHTRDASLSILRTLPASEHSEAGRASQGEYNETLEMDCGTPAARPPL